jgi:hypothetical protein
MSFSNSETDNMELDANGILAMLPDSDAATNGAQNVTMVTNQFASFAAPDGSPSVSLTDFVANPPIVDGTNLTQSFSGGKLNVYSADNSLLLSADLVGGLHGPLGGGDIQALLLGFGQITGGSMAGALDPNSLQFRMKFPLISGGFSISNVPTPHLNGFTTWTSSLEILATPAVPEIIAALPSIFVVWSLVSARRRR